uniref:Uncharacterized protein n=1 Tax=Rhizophora mucronata TaxID=61149 RepID=A0A2P2PF47_RHIMU
MHEYQMEGVNLALSGCARFSASMMKPGQPIHSAFQIQLC